MKRRSPAILAAVVVLGVSYLSYRDLQTSKQRARAVEHQKQAEATKPKATETDKELASPSSPSTTTERLEREGSTRFDKLADGQPVPPLPDSAPQRVKLGVAIFRYAGAQGAPESSRSKEEALILAKKALAEGEKEFALAVRHGDRGSAENIGWVPRSVLEKSVEYEVFRLETGGLLATPLDTPRGFWVVKRLR